MYAHDLDITVALFYTPVLLPVKSFQDPRHYYRNPPPSPPPQIFFLKVCVFSITINTSAQLFQHFANEMALQPDCEKQYTAAFMVKEISLFLFKPLVFTVSGGGWGTYMCTGTGVGRLHVYRVLGVGCLHVYRYWGWGAYMCTGTGGGVLTCVQGTGGGVLTCVQGTGGGVLTCVQGTGGGALTCVQVL